MNKENNRYMYGCPWCGAASGQPCMDINGKEYKDERFHRARLIKNHHEHKSK